MPTLEVFTLGGGEFLVNVFNAVAAWTGGGGYRSMLQVVFVMGLMYSLFVVAFNFDWRAWLNWFLQATAIYMMLLVPTVTVKVTDRLDLGLAPATVANVPLGLGLMASFTSQLGDWLTRTAETVFVMPVALQMQNNGIVYGARLMEKAQTFQITDPVFRANLDEHFKQCVFYDVLLGKKDMAALTNAPNLWAAMGPGSPAQAQRWITRVGSGTETTIIPCNTAYAEVTNTWAAMIDADLVPFSKTAYPKLPSAMAAQEMKNSLPQVAAAMHGTSADPYAYLQQVSTIDAFRAARESFSDSGWDAYASQRADAQARNTYTSIAQQAMTWVPLLGIVLQVVFYAMFPVIFPLFLFPKTGLVTLKGYATGFFYLASWGPLYVVLHMFVMNRAASAYAAMAPNGSTLLVTDGLMAVNNDIATIAGFLMMSVPFLAAGMAKGAMAIAGHATSMLAPAQGAAEAAAVERTTGNYAYGNTSFQNLTSNMRQANKWDERGFHSGGYASSSFTNPDGGVEMGFANGAFAFDTRQAISSMPFNLTRTAGFGMDMRQALHEGFSRVQGFREAANESWSATAQTGADLLESATRSASSSEENGSGFNSSVARMNDQVRSMSTTLQERFGLTESDSQRISRQSLLSSDGSLGVSGSAGASLKDLLGLQASAALGAKIAANHYNDTGETISSEEALSRVQEFVHRESNTDQARSVRDDFQRQTSTSSDSEVRSLSEKLSASLTDSRSLSREATQAEENYQRVERGLSELSSRGYQFNQNDVQEYINWERQELLNPENPLAVHAASVGYRSGMVSPNAEQAMVRDVLLDEFMNDRVQGVREQLGVAVPDMPSFSLQGPAITTAEGVRAFGTRNIEGVVGQGPDVNVRENSGDASLRSEVEERLGAGAVRLTGEGIRLDNAVDGAQDRADVLGPHVNTRNEQSLARSMPVISPIIEGAEQRIDDAKEWIGEKLGIGGGGEESSPAVQTDLGRLGSGFRTYSPQGEQYGTQGVIGELRASSAEWASRGGSPVNIGDISNRGGGDMAGHTSHEQGRQVDVRPFRHDGANAPTNWRGSSYDREQTREYIEMMKERNPGMAVLFNDPVLVREGLTEPHKGHDDHLHLSFPNRTTPSR